MAGRATGRASHSDVPDQSHSTYSFTALSGWRAVSATSAASLSCAFRSACFRFGADRLQHRAFSGRLQHAPRPGMRFIDSNLAGQKAGSIRRIVISCAGHTE